MADLDDWRIDRTEEAAPPPPSHPRWLLITVVAVLLIGGLAVWYFLRQQTPDTGEARTETEEVVEQQTPVEPPKEALELPPLDETDPLVRDLVRQLTTHPVVTAWLTTDQLIRNFTVAVMNVDTGRSPAIHLQPIAPEDDFRIRTENDTIYVDPASYRRYDGHAAAVDAIDAGGAARLYETLKPRIDEAYRELAGPDADFDRALERALVELLRTPVVEGDVALTSRTAGYAFADPRLESLTDAQKQLLRMGPRNVRTVQAKLREIAVQLEIPAASLPAERVITAGGT